VDDRGGGVPHVARFIQRRIEHQRDRQTDWTQPCNGAEVSEFTGSPLPQKRSRKPSKLDGHREYIIDRLKEYSLSASRIYREIQDRGFTGKYTIVKDFVHGSCTHLTE
jgi:transposase